MSWSVDSRWVGVNALSTLQPLHGEDEMQGRHRSRCELLTGCRVDEGTRLFWLHPGITGEQFQRPCPGLRIVSDRQLFNHRAGRPITVVQAQLGRLH